MDPESPEFAVARKAAYAKLDEAIEAIHALFVSKDESPLGDMPTDAVLLIGSQYIDDEGHRNGCVSVAPQSGWQPGYITAGLIAMAYKRVTD